MSAKRKVAGIRCINVQTGDCQVVFTAMCKVCTRLQLCSRCTYIHIIFELCVSDFRALVRLKVVQGFIDDFVADINVSLLASLGRQGAQSRVTKVKSSSAIGIPLAIGTVGATLTAVSDEEGLRGLLAVDCDNDLLSAVLGATLGSFEREVAHGDEVVAVDVVKSFGLDPVTHDGALVLVVEVAAAGLALLDVVVICCESFALEQRLG